MTGRIKKMRSALTALLMAPLQATAEASAQAENSVPVQVTKEFGEYTKCFILDDGTCMAVSTKLPPIITMTRKGIG